ncbi:hypothetical protein [Kingella negevensis]|uniref:hypothetical protein n=1 Tax=Kingella negevensis TaxID=1522312 RepID=UPI00050A12EF|nr:hypothetical protein [Kingella negevensis]MDK4688025.1 hypothetical protein [Kingella negevensis]WII90991.1 hypothetical protein QEO93_11415 [Kingella negevensis]
METQKLPHWFWQLLPVLTKRQNIDSFEQWLYDTQAESSFPNDVYQSLLWLNYRESCQVVITKLIELASQYVPLYMDDDRLYAIQFMTQLFSFEHPEYYWESNDEIWAFLPIDNANYISEYREIMEDYWYEFDRYSQEWESDISTEYKVFHLEYQRITTQLTEAIYKHITEQTDLPCMQPKPIFRQSEKSSFSIFNIFKKYF